MPTAMSLVLLIFITCEGVAKIIDAWRGRREPSGSEPTSDAAD
jgi:hypothetical protein